MTDNYANWWRGHLSSAGAGLANALDMTLVQRYQSQQHTIELFTHKRLGRVLVLDGIVVDAEHAPARREMLCHVPLLGHGGKPQHILIIGAASGGLTSEVLQHPGITSITIIDFDPELPPIVRNLFSDWPDYEQAYSDPRVEFIVKPPEQILATISQSGRRFDIIIDDLPRHSANANTTAAPAPDQAFYAGLANCLSGNGIAISSHGVLPRVGADSNIQNDIPGVFCLRPATAASFTHLDIFSAVHCYQVLDPLRAGGMTAVFICARQDMTFDQPRTSFSGCYYNREIHQQAFVLPTWWRNNADDIRYAHDVIQADTKSQKSSSIWYEQTYGSGISQALTMQHLYHEQSEFQSIEYYQHDVFGRVFVLDGTVQGSHADEFIYHEMAVHIPLLGRQREQVSALVIGGGDGGIVRELLKHRFVSKVVMVEIDASVIESANRFFNVQGNYNDPRVELIIGDAADYVTQAADEAFELIIVDATDSTTPSESLWTDEFFANLSRCLSADGVCLDSDIWIAGAQAYLSRDTLNPDLPDIQRALRFFPYLQCYYTRMPLFPGGNFVFFLYTKDGYSYTRPERDYLARHYNPELHQAAFALPEQYSETLNRLK